MEFEQRGLWFRYSCDAARNGLEQFLTRRVDGAGTCTRLGEERSHPSPGVRQVWALDLAHRILGLVSSISMRDPPQPPVGTPQVVLLFGPTVSENQLGLSVRAYFWEKTLGLPCK